VLGRRLTAEQCKNLFFKRPTKQQKKETAELLAELMAGPYQELSGAKSVH
jgi:hypothetical protein